MKKLLSLLVILVLVLSIAAPVSAAADGTGIQRANRFNVMLVVDGSASLAYPEGRKPASDPGEYRYDAIRIFLGLLTENGNNAGAVVFDDQIMLNTGLIPMNGMSSKIDLASRIETLKTRADTNIGTAMLTAVNELISNNVSPELPSVILLFSDGKNSLRTSSMMAKAAADADEAVRLANEAGIKIHCICLNNGDAGNVDGVVFYSNSTGGVYEEITDAADLSEAFQRFYSIINNTDYDGTSKKEFGDDGVVDTGFTVPRFGVEEVNIVIELKESLRNIEITRPDGTVLNRSTIESMSMRTKNSRYQLVKIPEPLAGRWNVRIEGAPHDTVDFSMLYNSSMSVTLTVDNDDNFMLNTPYRFHCDVADSSMFELTSDDLASMDAVLHITNANNPTETMDMPMSVDNGYSLDYSFRSEGAYYIYATVSCDGFAMSTDRMLINIGNKPPVCNGDITGVEVKTGLFQSNTWVEDIAEHFTDPENEPLTFRLADNSYGEAAELDGSTVTANCKDLGEVYLTVIATDPHNASAEMNIHLSEKNMTPIVIRNICIAIAAIALIVFLIIHHINNRRCEINITVKYRDVSGNWSASSAIYSFRGKYDLFRTGVISIRKTYIFFATESKNLCRFKAKTPLYDSNGREIKTVDIHPNMTYTFYFNNPAQNKTSECIEIVTSNPNGGLF